MAIKEGALGREVGPPISYQGTECIQEKKVLSVQPTAGRLMCFFSDFHPDLPHRSISAELLRSMRVPMHLQHKLRCSSRACSCHYASLQTQSRLHPGSIQASALKKSTTWYTLISGALTAAAKGTLLLCRHTTVPQDTGNFALS